MIIGRESPKLTGDSLTDAKKLNSWNREFTENYNLESSQMQKQIAALESGNASLKQQVIDDNAGLQEQITEQAGLFTAAWKAKVQACINALYAAALPDEDLPFDET